MHNEQWIDQINQIRKEFEAEPKIVDLADAYERTWEVEFNDYTEMKKLAAFHVVTRILQDAHEQQDERKWNVAAGLTLAMIRKWDLVKMKKAISVPKVMRWRM